MAEKRITESGFFHTIFYLFIQLRVQTVVFIRLVLTFLICLLFSIDVCYHQEYINQLTITLCLYSAICHKYSCEFLVYYFALLSFFKVYLIRCQFSACLKILNKQSIRLQLRCGLRWFVLLPLKLFRMSWMYLEFLSQCSLSVEKAFLKFARNSSEQLVISPNIFLLLFHKNARNLSFTTLLLSVFFVS